MTDPANDSAAFSDLGLSAPTLEALAAVGYESASPIQVRTIPLLLSGRDLLGQAQTGTGKTAAFALPLLERIDVERREPQALVLVPTRELAIQVAQAFEKYAAGRPGFHVLPIYGGQSYTPQLKALKRGPHVIVATPGRVIDHAKRGALSMATLRFIVLDEADEMLQMGFVDDIEWVLEQAPAERQIALFSATMAPAIRRIAHRHLREPAEVTIRSRTTTASNIRQRYWLVGGMHKLDALTRILEVEEYGGVLVFVRTKLATVELAERLEERGFAVAALNGDIPQQQRERVVERLRKAGDLDIVVATDVAARGLDVERISHVVNYDVPYDSESYIHRIGRTGRAGRSGEAILFIASRERNMLRIIERATRQPIEPMTLPTAADVNRRRIERFKTRVLAAMESDAGAAFVPVLEEIEREHAVPGLRLAAALASIAQGEAPFLLPEDREPREPRSAFGAGARGGDDRDRGDRGDDRGARDRGDDRGRAHRDDDSAMETYRIEVGYVHYVQPGNIVGAIANEAGLDGRRIGHIDIRDDHSYVDLPAGMPKEIYRALKLARIGARELRITRVDSKPPKRPKGMVPKRAMGKPPPRTAARPQKPRRPAGAKRG